MNLSYAVAAAESDAMSLADKGLISAKTVLTGFVVVFVVLILLILIINVYSAIVQKAQKAAENSRSKKQAADVSAETPAPAAVNEAAADSVIDGIPQETIAVISAAVAAYGSSSGKNVRIKGIKKSAERGRSAWANAGVLDNTRPF